MSDHEKKTIPAEIIEASNVPLFYSGRTVEIEDDNLMHVRVHGTTVPFAGFVGPAGESLGDDRFEGGMRGAQKAQARTHPDLLKTIAHTISCVMPQDALGWSAACGYNFI